MVLLLVLIIAVAGVAYWRDHNKKDTNANQLSQYLNFGGDYVFSVPRLYTVDEHAIAGVQLVYSGNQSARTLEDIYNASGFSVQAIADYTSSDGDGFKNYINTTFMPQIKKSLATENIDLKFGKSKGWDTAKAVAIKDGQSYRVLFLKNGKHPAAVVAKSETDAVTTVQTSLVDVEDSDLKKDVASLKKTIEDIAKLAKEQKAQDIFNNGAPDWKSKTSQEEIANALRTAKPYTDGNIVVGGGSYTPGEFTAAVKYTKLDDKEGRQPGFGVIAVKKIDGKWQLIQLSLPRPQ